MVSDLVNFFLTLHHHLLEFIKLIEKQTGLSYRLHFYILLDYFLVFLLCGCKPHLLVKIFLLCQPFLKLVNHRAVLLKCRFQLLCRGVILKTFLLVLLYDWVIYEYFNLHKYYKVFLNNRYHTYYQHISNPRYYDILYLFILYTVVYQGVRFFITL